MTDNNSNGSHKNGQSSAEDSYLEEELQELIKEVRVWRKFCKDTVQKLGEMNDIFREKGTSI